MVEVVVEVEAGARGRWRVEVVCGEERAVGFAPKLQDKWVKGLTQVPAGVASWRRWEQVGVSQEGREEAGAVVLEQVLRRAKEPWKMLEALGARGEARLVARRVAEPSRVPVALPLVFWEAGLEAATEQLFQAGGGVKAGDGAKAGKAWGALSAAEEARVEAEALAQGEAPVGKAQARRLLEVVERGREGGVLAQERKAWERLAERMG